MEMTGVAGVYRVRLRPAPGIHAWARWNGAELFFRPGPAICPCLSVRYAGEALMRPVQHEASIDVAGLPEWIAAGDLELLEATTYPHPPPGYKPDGQPQQGDLITP